MRFAKDGTQLIGEWEEGKITSGKHLSGTGDQWKAAGSLGRRRDLRHGPSSGIVV